MEGSSGRKMLSGRKPLKQFGFEQRLMIGQKAADLMTFRVQNKVILSLSFQCVVWYWSQNMHVLER